MTDAKKKALLIAAIANAFVQHTEEDTLLVTEDGNCFLPKDKSAAEYHGRSTKQKVNEVKRSEYLREIENIVDLNEAMKIALQKEAEEKALLEKEAAEKEAADKEAKEKADAEAAALAKAAEELKARALAVGLPEDATELEIKAAEAGTSDSANDSKEDTTKTSKTKPKK